MKLPRLIGMVHAAPLPGAPRFAGSIDDVVRAAVSDATALQNAGFGAVMIENFGDEPFFADTVPAETVASLTRVVAEVAAAVSVPVGVNVLRNDGMAAVAVAAATGAAFVRVNVLSGTMFTDQGPLVGRAAEIARLRAAIAPDVSVLADVFVKHAVPPAGATLERAAVDTWERAGADGLVLSGTGTGDPTDPGQIDAVRRVLPDAPLVVGSGVTVETVGPLLAVADAAIVGTSIKMGAVTVNPVDPERARALVEAAS